MDQSGMPIIVLGFLLGMKHSLDVDHLAAVSTLLGGRAGTLKTMLVGMYWGLGHALALVVLGGLIVLLDLRFPPEVSLAAEGLVGGMLMFLGVRVFVRLARGGVLHLHPHRHGDHVHLHPHIHAPEHAHPPRHAHSPRHALPPQPTHASRVDGTHHHGVAATGRPSRASFIVGMVHGLAGSAGVTLILLPTMSTRAAGIAYLAVFGLGTICGMALSTLALSLPIRALEARGSGRPARWVTLAAGSVSFFIGALLFWETFIPFVPHIP